MPFPVEYLGSRSFPTRLTVMASVTVLGPEHRPTWLDLHQDSVGK